MLKMVKEANIGDTIIWNEAKGLMFNLNKVKAQAKLEGMLLAYRDVMVRIKRIKDFQLIEQSIIKKLGELQEGEQDER